MKKASKWFVLIVVLCLLLSACSVRNQARVFDGTINLGDLPEDMLYVNGAPQLITVSTESDGDVVLAYRSTDNHVYAQLYGCAYINISCDKLFKQGRYEWNIPAGN